MSVANYHGQYIFILRFLSYFEPGRNSALMDSFATDIRDEDVGKNAPTEERPAMIRIVWNMLNCFFKLNCIVSHAFNSIAHIWIHIFA